MKIGIWLLLSSAIVAMIIWYGLRKDTIKYLYPKNVSPSSFTVKPKQVENVNFANNTYQAAWLAAKPGNISLFSNLPYSKTAKTIQKEKNCVAVISGGFYSKDNRHIGLLVSENQILSKFRQNQTFDGFLFEDTDRLVKIADHPPGDNLRFILQSGPLLIKKGQKRILKISNDAAKRRIVVAITKDGTIYFLAVYLKESVYQGPYLSNLPDILELIEEKLNIHFTDALNLDGGTASAFLSSYHSLEELSPIGSYFCITQ